jgi:pimeloyl-ACP methyl ester carboxylesterase
MVSLRYAREYGRARSLTLVGTAATGEKVDREAFEALFEAPDALSGAFTPAFPEARSDLVERIVGWRREEDTPADVREAQLAAALSFDAGPLYELAVPALVLHGEHDEVFPHRWSERAAARIPEGEFRLLDDCAHWAPRERPDTVVDLIREFVPR